MTRSLQECLKQIHYLKESILCEDDDLELEKELLSKNVGKWIADIGYSGDEETLFLHKDGTWQRNHNPCADPDYFQLDDYLLANSPEHLVGIINKLRQSGQMEWPKIWHPDVFRYETNEDDVDYYEVRARMIPPLRYKDYTTTDDLESAITEYWNEHWDNGFDDITNEVNFVEDMKQKYGAK